MPTLSGIKDKKKQLKDSFTLQDLYKKKMCVALAENHRTASIIRIHKEPCPLRLTPGPHYAKVPIDTSTDHVCVVCSEKHHRYKNQNPGVLFKNNPHKKSKTTIICTLCQRYLCVKRGSTCFEDWHTKREYWH